MFDDQSAAMDVLLNGKELFARQVRLLKLMVMCYLFAIQLLHFSLEKMFNFTCSLLISIFKLVSVFPGERKAIYISSFICCIFSIMI